MQFIPGFIFQSDKTPGWCYLLSLVTCKLQHFIVFMGSVNNCGWVEGGMWQSSQPQNTRVRPHWIFWRRFTWQPAFVMLSAVTCSSSSQAHKDQCKVLINSWLISSKYGSTNGVAICKNQIACRKVNREKRMEKDGLDVWIVDVVVNVNTRLGWLLRK